MAMQEGSRKTWLVALAAVLALHGGVWLALNWDGLPVSPERPPFSVVEAQLVQAVVAAPQPQPKSEPRPEKPAHRTETVVPRPAQAPTAATAPAEQPAAATTSAPPAASEAKATAEAYIEPDYRVAYLNNPPPPYPLAARRRGLTGKVLLRVEVTVDGNCAEVKVAQSSGHGLLDETAVEAVKKWRFVPAKRGGRAVAAMVTIPINFKLENGEG